MKRRTGRKFRKKLRGQRHKRKSKKVRRIKIAKTKGEGN